MSDHVEEFRYRWFVLIVSFTAELISFGTFYSVGVLCAEWDRYFGVPTWMTSFVGSLPMAISCFGGPIYGFVGQLLGDRKCGFLGGIFLFVGFVSSYFADNIFSLLPTFGIIAGVGLGLTNIAFNSSVNSYFKKDRALAEGVIGGGIGVGMVLSSPLIEKSIRAYTWKGSMLLIGGYFLNLCVCAVFYIPASKIRNHPLNFWRERERPIRSRHVAKLDSKPSNLKVEGQGSFVQKTSRLWRRPLFHMILWSNLFFCIAIFVPYVHVVMRARKQGFSIIISTWMSSAVGIASIIGRPITGFICSHYQFDPVWSYCACQIILGVAAVLTPFWSDVYGLFAFAILVGFLSNNYGLIKFSAAHLLGSESFVEAYSWMLFTEGIGVGIGPLLVGAIYDVTESYDWPFRFSGFLYFASAIICVLRNPLQKMEKESQTKCKTSSILTFGDPS